MKKHKIFAVILVIVVTALIAFKLIKNKIELNKKNKQISEKETVVSVTVEEAKILPVQQSLTKTGVLQPLYEVDVVTATPGKINEIRFELGSQVKAGQVLALLDNKMLRLNLEKIDITIEKLQKDSARFQTLFAGNATTEMSVNEVMFNLANAQNQRDQIKKQIDDAMIKAPVSGTIIRKNFDVGEFVNPGMPIGTIVDISNLKLQVQVTEKEVYQIFEGQKVKITSDILPGKTFEGNVSYVSPKGDETHNYLVEIRLENDPQKLLKGGLFVYAEFQGEKSENVLQIPRSALVESLADPFVYGIENGKAVKRNIKAGREIGENIEVLQGLTPGEKVITSGQNILTENAPVTIAAPNSHDDSN